MKNIIITGASSGIGNHLSKFLISAGYNVINFDLKKNNNSKTHYIKCNLSNLKSIESAMKVFEKTFKNVNVLINNAAVTYSSNFLNYNLNNWHKTLTVNLTAPFFLSKLCAKNMIKNKTKGCIINITSIGAELAFPNNPAYQASKAGLKHLTKAMAYDLAKFDIRVNNIVPGYTKTKMNINSWKNKKLRKKRANRNLLNRWAEPDEMNSSVMFLIDKKSSFVNGIDLKVDGGWSIKGL